MYNYRVSYYSPHLLERDRMGITFGQGGDLTLCAMFSILVRLVLLLERPGLVHGLRSSCHIALALGTRARACAMQQITESIMM